MSIVSATVAIQRECVPDNQQALHREQRHLDFRPKWEKLSAPRALIASDLTPAWSAAVAFQQSRDSVAAPAKGTAAFLQTRNPKWTSVKIRKGNA
jgi:hypothetical protein